MGIPPPDSRNPFAGKGLAVTLALLLRPLVAQSVADLAAAAEASRPMAGKVVGELRRRGLVAGEVRQGKEGALWPTSDLLHETALHWPSPVALVSGGHPEHLDAAVGGGPAAGQVPSAAWDAPLRVYVRSADAARTALADAGGFVVSGGAVDWEIVVVDFPFAAGDMPPVVAALELGSTSRGREMLASHGAHTTEGWHTA